MREIREPEDAIDKRDTERAERQLAAIGEARHQNEIGKDDERVQEICHLNLPGTRAGLRDRP